jgi:glutamate N-acetyltransferase/amino-acid N-acetyltransferase
VSTGVTYPRGFRAAGIAAGLKPSGRRDLALLAGGARTTAAGLFTTNRIVAAPVTLSKARLAAGRGTAVLVNSGQANAATGSRGGEDAQTATEAAAKVLALEPDDVLACSTGVIGEPVHLPELLSGIGALADELSTEGGAAFAEAILTTDTVAKHAQADAGPYRVGGAAKGVGMISPNLATMLAFVTTDAAVPRADLDRLSRDHLRPHFDTITVDGSTSTNDTVLVFASGAAGSEPVAAGTPAWASLAAAVHDVGGSLASQLIGDAEGGNHVIVVEVEGASSEADARAAATAVANSPLVKTAAFGEDPNPGRILQAIGASGVEFDPSVLDVWLGDSRLVEGGLIPPAYFDAGSLRGSAASAMAEPEFTLRVRLGDGPGRSRVLGCDLSYEYVRINGEYTT